MPNVGDSFVVKILQVHRGWGTPPGRVSPSRAPRTGEGYIKIPKCYAREFNIFNSNKTGANTSYRVSCVNGTQIKGKLLAQGCTKAGDVYAKQFSAKGNLRKIGDWYKSVNAQVGGKVKVTFTSPRDLAIEYIPKPD